MAAKHKSNARPPWARLRYSAESMASKRSAPRMQEGDGVPRSTTDESARPNAKRQKTSSLMASAQKTSTPQDGDTSYRCAPLTRTTTSTHLNGYEGRGGIRGVTPFCSSAPTGGVSWTPWQEASANQPETTSHTTPPAVPEFSMSEPLASHYTRTAVVKKEGSRPSTARSSKARSSSPAPPPPPPKVDCDWVDQRLEGEQMTARTGLEAFLEEKKRNAIEGWKGATAQDQQRGPGAQQETLTPRQAQIQRHVTRKPTPPDRHGKPYAHLSNLDDVRKLIRFLRRCKASLSSDLREGRFRDGEQDTEYTGAMQRLQWKKRSLGRQASIIEWLESADRPPHSSTCRDLLEIHLTVAIPYDEFKIRPNAKAEGLESAIIWLCRQIKDLEQSPLHYRPAPPGAESEPAGRHRLPERSRFLKDTYGLLQSLVEEQFKAKERKKRVEALAEPVEPRAKGEVGTASKVVTESVRPEHKEIEDLVEDLLKEKTAAAARTQANAQLRLGPSPVRAWHRERAARRASLDPATAVAELKEARKELRGSLYPLARELRAKRAARGASHGGLTAQQGTDQSVLQPTTGPQGGFAAGDPTKQPSTPVRAISGSPDSYSPMSVDSSRFPELGGQYSPISPGWSPQWTTDGEGDGE